MGGSEPGAEALRVGSLCGAYRWVLWAGLLIPLTLVAVSLVMPALAAPALLFAAALLLPGIFGWAWVDVRAAQGEGRRQAR